MPDIFTVQNQPNTQSSEEKSLELVSHSHPFTAFCTHPTASFQNQEKDERIYLLLRRHMVTNTHWILGSFLLAFVPLFIFLGLQFLSEKGSSPIIFLPNRYIFILALFYYLIVFGYAFMSFLSWFFNVSLITGRRIIDIDYSDLVYHDVATTSLGRIREVLSVQTGLTRSLANFGDVYAKIEGVENTDLDLLSIPKPAQATEIIQRLIRENK